MKTNFKNFLEIWNNWTIFYNFTEHYTIKFTIFPKYIFTKSIKYWYEIINNEINTILQNDYKIIIKIEKIY